MLFVALFIYGFDFASALYNVSDDVLFNIKWPGSSDESKQSYSHIFKSLNNEQYRCSFPSNIMDRYSTPDNEHYSGPDELSLIKPLFQQNACSYKIESYWTYELCHGRHIRQFHQEQQQNSQNIRILQEYILGRYNKDQFEENFKNVKSNKIPKIDIDGKAYPYFQVNLTNGDTCDLTGRPRETNVLYICQSEGRGEVYDMSEIESCQYRIVVITKLLCENPAYRVHRSYVNDISCVPLNSAHNKPLSLAKLENEADKKTPVSSTLSGLFSDDRDQSGNTIQVEAQQVGGSIVYRIKKNLPGMENDPQNQIPSEPPKTPVGNPQSTAKERNELLHNFLTGSYCVSGGSGWWKHEVCFMNKIIQYHDSSPTERTLITLGQWDMEEHRKWLKKHPSKRGYEPAEDREHFWQFYSNGDYCNESKKNRDVSVKIKCLHDNSISVTILFQEPHTCQYVITLESAIFCPLVKGTDPEGLTIPSLHD